jgi:hypothetical protein
MLLIESNRYIDVFHFRCIYVFARTLSLVTWRSAPRQDQLQCLRSPKSFDIHILHAYSTRGSAKSGLTETNPPIIKHHRNLVAVSLRHLNTLETDAVHTCWA